MRKRLLALLLAVVMTVGLLPTAAFAAGAEHDVYHTGWTSWDKIDALPKEAGSYYLTRNVTVQSSSSATWWQIKNDIKLCLNGRTIKFENGTDGNPTHIRVSSSGSLTLYACGGGQN